MISIYIHCCYLLQVLDKLWPPDCPLCHRLWLFLPCLPLQCLGPSNSGLEALQPSKHNSREGREDTGLEGGPHGAGSLLPTGSHLGSGFLHLWLHVCASTILLQYTKLSPRSGKLLATAQAILATIAVVCKYCPAAALVVHQRLSLWCIKYMKPDHHCLPFQQRDFSWAKILAGSTSSWTKWQS